ncbi:MAG TPA: hypothetical protein VL422_05270 [Miltoncostaea sp.]|nr:hypothetical protein [Miltoncostaea sp.]
MRRRTIAAIGVALAVAVGAAAGCGGDSKTSEPTTQATTAAATTPAPVTTPGTTPTTGGASTAPAAKLTKADLPPENAVAGVHPGTPRTIDSASEFVDVLYQTGDPAKPAAVTRLENAGYTTAILRDQAGTDPETGVALLRSYAIQLGSPEAAKKEVGDAVAEVKSASAAKTSDIDTGIPDAQGLRVDIDQGAVQGAVVFITFPVGSRVYGIQAVATSGGNLNQDELLKVARDLATKAGATS